jgi:hypothetical protein
MKNQHNGSTCKKWTKISLEIVQSKKVCYANTPLESWLSKLEP